MKVAITGHSTGIGNALYTLIRHKTEHEVWGFSRLNGYDLQDPALQHKMFGTIDRHGIDVFINNAYADQMQIDLFELAMRSWSHRPEKVIVNIISRAAYTGSPENPDYATWKRELQKIAQKAAFQQNPQCQVINVYPGLTDTSRVKSVPGNKLDADLVAEMVWNAVESPAYIQELVFGARPDK